MTLKTTANMSLMYCCRLKIFCKHTNRQSVIRAERFYLKKFQMQISVYISLFIYSLLAHVTYILREMYMSLTIIFVCMFGTHCVYLNFM